MYFNDCIYGYKEREQNTESIKRMADEKREGCLSINSKFGLDKASLSCQLDDLIPQLAYIYKWSCIITVVTILNLFLFQQFQVFSVSLSLLFLQYDVHKQIPVLCNMCSVMR